MKSVHGTLFVLSLTVALSANAQHHHGITVTDTHVETPHDNVPRFCNDPDDSNVPSVIAVKTGNWSDPGTWSTSEVPGSEARVSIPGGQTVTYDVASSVNIDCVEVGMGGHLKFASDRSTLLRLNNLQVLPGGTLTVGTEQSPIGADHEAEIVIRATPLDTSGRDPEQFGGTVMVFGDWYVHGARKQPTFVRLSAEPQPGDRTLRLSTAVSGWKPGDRLLLPDSHEPDNDHDGNHREEPVIRQISADGLSLELESPLQHDHPGARDRNGTIDFLPHVGNMTRNVVIRSEDPSVLRGHTIAFHRAYADVRYAQLIELGRTTTEEIDNTTLDSSGDPTHIGDNQIARYAIHTHHLIGPMSPRAPHQFRFTGNVVDGALKWGMTIHASHYGLIDENIVYRAQGSGIVTEDGSESYNVFEKNFVVGTKSPQKCDTGESKSGVSGDAFWFAGANNNVRANVAADNDCFAYTYFMQRNNGKLPRMVRYPSFQGADPHDSDQSIEVDVRDVPLREFHKNEMYNAETGMNIWDLGADDPRFPVRNVLQDTVLWHYEDTGIFSYHALDLTIDRFVVRGDMTNLDPNRAIKYRIPKSAAIQGVRSERDTIIRNCDIQGVKTGIVVARDLGTPAGVMGTELIENNYILAHEGIEVSTPVERDRSSDRRVTIHRNQWDELPVQTSTDGPDEFLVMFYDSGHDDDAYLERTTEIFAIDNNDDPGSYRIFFNEQHPGGIPIGGEYAPCSDSSCSEAAALAASMNIDGLAFVSGVDPPGGNDTPPAPPRGVRLK